MAAASLDRPRRVFVRRSGGSLVSAYILLLVAAIGIYAD